MLLNPKHAFTQNDVSKSWLLAQSGVPLYLKNDSKTIYFWRNCQITFSIIWHAKISSYSWKTLTVKNAKYEIDYLENINVLNKLFKLIIKEFI